jgi:uncharacterized YigZ family protein
MKYVQEEFSNTIEIKKSKFIAHLIPYNHFDEVMVKLKDLHPKARHFVYAYRYLNQFDQIVENSSDDGEPKGTSGKPALKVLEGALLINSAVIIVRYFGGTRLGTGGLVRAYGDAVNEVIQVSELYEYKKLSKKVLKISYSQLSKIQYLIKNLDIQITNTIFENDIILELSSTKSEFEKLNLQLPLGLELGDD